MTENYSSALKLIEETLTIYEENKERLRFNLYYEKGEILRKQKRYESAIQYYKQSLESSEYNGDKNIQLYSWLGIISCEISGSKHEIHPNKEAQEKRLLECKELCYNDEIICFNLGLQHVQLIMQVLNGTLNNSELDQLNLPLF